MYEVAKYDVYIILFFSVHVTVCNNWYKISSDASYVVYYRFAETNLQRNWQAAREVESSMKINNLM